MFKKLIYFVFQEANETRAAVALVGTTTTTTTMTEKFLRFYSTTEQLKTKWQQEQTLISSIDSRSWRD